MHGNCISFSSVKIVYLIPELQVVIQTSSFSLSDLG